ncbi:hypothetical protein EV424DRAFT_1342403 [Suillus variegatus]|nr:hypothetical protein EV424DRAFT_1342403 [Suillus variegatus]
MNDNFEHLDKVPNSSGRYFWKYKHCGHLDNSPGAKIQGRDNNLGSHIIRHCKNATPELCRKARSFINNAEVLGGKAFDFAELDWVDRGIVPQAAVDEVDVVDHDGEDDGWDEASLVSSVGVDFTARVMLLGRTHQARVIHYRVLQSAL